MIIPAHIWDYLRFFVFLSPCKTNIHKAMKLPVPVVAAILTLVPHLASAQFYLSGDDPASSRWYYIESPHFKVIYPDRLDSMARSYILELEKYRIPVSRSAGFIPGEAIRGKMPVVLHPFNAASNGSVAWAPKRMDLYTSPPAYEPEPMPWTTMLGIHESRHVAQMQFGLSNCFRPFRYILGEMFAGGMAGIYPDKWLLEGDAVVAETALSGSGRGRTSNFMNYYRIAFDAGDFRDADRWAYGSYWHYTPDHYAFGYMTLSGIRYLYDVPDFSGRLFTHYSKRPYDIVARNTVSKETTGRKFRTLVSEAEALYHSIWTKDAEERKPFLQGRRLTETPDVYTWYSGNVIAGDTIYSLKESFNRGRKLVKIGPDGKEKTVTAFGSDVSRLCLSESLGKIFWSETVPDIRWSLKYGSFIRSLDLETGEKRTLTRDGRLFNPAASPAGKYISVTEYTDDGRSRLCILDGNTGKMEASFMLPDTLQLIETAWLGDGIYATAISGDGYGIYRLDTGEGCGISTGKGWLQEGNGYFWTSILAPSPVMIFNFGRHGEYLMFTSDRTGTNEMYLMDPHSGEVFQETSIRYGGTDFTFSGDGSRLLYSAPDRTGEPLAVTSAGNLLHRKVDFSERYWWEVADSLGNQEKRLAEEGSTGVSGQTEEEIEISAPERFRKFPHLFNLHSWAPVYFNYDNISRGSYDDYYSYASVGASAFFQNRLGTFTGFAGYSFHEDPVTDGAYLAGQKSRWRHSGHLKLTYSGLFPVIEASLDINDRTARNLRGSTVLYLLTGEMASAYNYSYSRTTPLVSGSLSMYIPFNFSSGGWSRGLIPEISYSISNDTFDSGHDTILSAPDMATGGETRHVVKITSGKKSFYQAISASLRFYMMQPAAHADVYPEWGFGIEAGASAHPGITDMVSPSAYLYSYGYIPGIYGNQGLRLTALFNRKLSGTATPLNTTVNVLPRGFTSGSWTGGIQDYSSLSSWAAGQASGVKLTADYAMPFPMGDFHIGNLFYVTRGIITPHFDWSFIGRQMLFSAGATLEIEFGNFIGLQFPTTLGITYSFNGGPSFDRFRNAGLRLGRHFVGPVFNMSF